MTVGSVPCEEGSLELACGNLRVGRVLVGDLRPERLSVSFVETPQTAWINWWRPQ